MDFDVWALFSLSFFYNLQNVTEIYGLFSRTVTKSLEKRRESLTNTQFMIQFIPNRVTAFSSISTEIISHNSYHFISIFSLRENCFSYFILFLFDFIFVLFLSCSLGFTFLWLGGAVVFVNETDAKVSQINAIYFDFFYFDNKWSVKHAEFHYIISNKTKRYTIIQ